MSGTFTAVIFTVIGIVFKIVFDWVYRVTNNVDELGYTKTFKRGECEDTITFNPTETIIKLEIDWDRYDPFDPHMEAISKLIELAWSGENGTPMKYLKELEEAESSKNRRIEMNKSIVVNVTKKVDELTRDREKIIEERDSVELKYRRLKKVVRDQNKFIAPLLKEPEEQFHDEPPF